MKQKVLFPLPVFVVLLFLAPVSVIAQHQEVTLTRWDNTTRSGTLAGISADGRKFNIRRNGEMRKVALRNLLNVSFQHEGDSRTQPIVLHLRDGGKIHGSIRKSESDESVRIRSPDLQEPITVRFTRVERIRFPLTEGRLTENRKKDLESKGILYKTNGDFYVGFIAGVGPKQIVFNDSDLGERTLKHEEVLQVDLAPIGSSPDKPSDVYLEVHGRSGSVLMGTPVSTSGGTLVLKGFFNNVRWKIPFKNIQTLLIKNGKTTYLSDRDPWDVVQKLVFPWQPDPADAPGMPYRFQWRRDRAVPDRPGRKEPIVLNGKTYQKGISCTAYTKLTYKLDGAFSTFQSTVGLLDQPNGTTHEGSAAFRVYVDGTRRYNSGVRKASAFPESVEVDVSNADRMRLEVDLGNGYLDFAVWAGARLIRRHD